MLVYTTLDGSLLERAPSENLKPSSKPAADTSSYSIYTARNALTSTIYPSAALSASFA